MNAGTNPNPKDQLYLLRVHLSSIDEHQIMRNIDELGNYSNTIHSLRVLGIAEASYSEILDLTSGSVMIYLFTFD